MRGALVGALVVLTMAVFATLPTSGVAGPTTNAPIQPGAPLGWGTPAWCTQGFIFRDAAGAWYGSTAGHCYNLGDFVINNEAGDWFGQVVFQDMNIDFALFKVLAGKEGLVNPAVRLWGGPTGVATPADVLARDRIAVAGYPLGLGDGHPVTNPYQNYAQGRLGYASGIFNGQAHYTAPIINGDSGGPVLLHKNGLALAINRALAVHSNLPNAVAINDGPSIQQALATMSAAGFQVTLQTAPFTPIPV